MAETITDHFVNRLESIARTSGADDVKVIIDGGNMVVDAPDKFAEALASSLSKSFGLVTTNPSPVNGKTSISVRNIYSRAETDTGVATDFKKAVLATMEKVKSQPGGPRSPHQ
jgi:hypothetical protein